MRQESTHNNELVAAVCAERPDSVEIYTCSVSSVWVEMALTMHQTDAGNIQTSTRAFAADIPS